MALRTSCLILCLLCGPSVVSAQNAPIFLRGFEVTREHVVFSTIEHVTGNTAILNLGYAHGVQAGQRFLVVRAVGEEVIPVSGLTVRESHPDHANALIEGPAQLVIGDLALIPADRLDVWSPHPRAEQLALKKLIRQQAVNRYDTFTLSPALVDEVHRDDDYQRRRFSHRQNLAFVRDAAGRSAANKGRLGAVRPTPPHDPKDRTVKEEEEVDTSDTTVAGLTRFIDLVHSPDGLEPLLTFERLRQLQPVDRRFVVTQDTTPVLRRILMSWTRQILPTIAAPPPAGEPEAGTSEAVVSP